MPVLDLPPDVQCIVYVNTLTENKNYEPKMAVRVKEEGGEFKSLGDTKPLVRKSEVQISLPIHTKKFFVDLVVPGQGGGPVSYAIRSPATWQDWEVSKNPSFVIVWEDDDTGGLDAYKDNDIVAAVHCPKK